MTQTTERLLQWRGLDLTINDRVLVPREETQLLVLEAMKCETEAWVHEVGTGCGAVALSIKQERPDLIVTASDIDPGAIDVAALNAKALNLDVEIMQGMGLNPIRDRIESQTEAPTLIVANLPYLSDEAMSTRPPEVAEEPKIATQGECGPDGLGEIRILISETPSGVKLALEHDTHHGPAVREMLDDAKTHYDYSGSERMTVGISRG